MAPLPASFSRSVCDLDLGELLQNLTDPMNIIDRDYRVVWTNAPDPEPGQEALRVEGKVCYRVFMGRETPCRECPIREVFQSGRPTVMEKKAEPSSGFWFHTEVWAYPIHNPDGSLNRVIKIGHHIKNGRERLEQNKAPFPGRENHAPDFQPVNAALESDLSPREREVLGLLARGMTNIEIADELMISPHTVKTHVIGLFNKFGTTKRTQTAVMAVRLGLV